MTSSVKTSHTLVYLWSFISLEALNIIKQYYTPKLNLFGSSYYPTNCCQYLLPYKLWLLQLQYKVNKLAYSTSKLYQTWSQKSSYSNVFGSACPQTNLQKMWCPCTTPLSMLIQSNLTTLNLGLALIHFPCTLIVIMAHNLLFMSPDSDIVLILQERLAATPNLSSCAWCIGSCLSVPRFAPYAQHRVTSLGKRCNAPWHSYVKKAYNYMAFDACTHKSSRRRHSWTFLGIDNT